MLYLVNLAFNFIIYVVLLYYYIKIYYILSFTYLYHK